MKIRNQKGASLVAVMVAMALTGVLALVIAQIMGDGNKNKNILEAKFEMIVIHNEIYDTLRNIQNCTESLKTLNAVTGAGTALTKLKFKAKNGTFIDKYLINTMYNGEIKINSYQISDSDPDVDVALEGTTNLTINYQIPNSYSLSKKIKIFTLVDAANKITKCSAAGSLQGGAGVSPGGKCITKMFDFHRWPGAGVVAATSSTPGSAGTVTGAGGVWRQLNLYCPTDFPMAISGMVSPACSRIDETLVFLTGANGSTNGVSCGMIFLENHPSYTPDQIAAAIVACDAATFPASGGYRVGGCNITCCDL
jgi:hypothetical protein